MMFGIVNDADPLVGMGLLYGFKVQIEAVEGGRVTLEALPDSIAV